MEEVLTHTQSHTQYHMHTLHPTHSIHSHRAHTDIHIHHTYSTTHTHLQTPYTHTTHTHTTYILTTHTCHKYSPHIHTHTCTPFTTHTHTPLPYTHTNTSFFVTPLLRIRRKQPLAFGRQKGSARVRQSRVTVSLCALSTILPLFCTSTQERGAVWAAAAKNRADVHASTHPRRVLSCLPPPSTNNAKACQPRVSGFSILIFNIKLWPRSQSGHPI